MMFFRAAVVSNNQEYARKLKIELENRGASVIWEADPIEAISKVGSQNPDLVLVDENMVSIDGCQFLLAFRANFSTDDIAVVLLTGQRKWGGGLGAEDILAFYGEDADAYIEKTPDPADLIPAVLGVVSNLQNA